MSDHHFNTPPEFLALVRQVSTTLSIGLDPCSNAYSQVQADTTYRIKDNGLVLPWRGHGLVFMNPPHSQSPHNIEPWMEKAADSFLKDPPDRWNGGDSFLGLLPSKTDTEWFHAYVPRFTIRCFLQGRLRFWLNGKPTSGSGKFANLVVYQGLNIGKFRQAFGPHGYLI